MDLAQARNAAEATINELRGGLDAPPLPAVDGLREVAKVWAERAAAGDPNPVRLDEVPDADQAYGGVGFDDFIRRDPANQEGLDGAARGAALQAQVPYIAPGIDSHGAGVALVVPSPSFPTGTGSMSAM